MSRVLTALAISLCVVLPRLALGDPPREHIDETLVRFVSALFVASEIVEVIECVELEDGPAMWEDKLAYDLERSDWNQEKVDGLGWKIDQILYGRDHAPRFTFFVAAVEKL